MGVLSLVVGWVACLSLGTWVLFMVLVLDWEELSDLAMDAGPLQPSPKPPPLRFRPNGRFKILQIADMHFANGAKSGCENVLPSEQASCSDLNTTAFIDRLISAEQPDFLVFSGDNIFSKDCWQVLASLKAAFAPAIKAGIPWAAILGNHDSEAMKREKVMREIVKMDYTLARIYPHGNARDPDVNIDGYGNYDLQVYGPAGPFENQSMLNLYFLDSGDYSKDRKVKGYNWIQKNQKQWFLRRSAELQRAYKEESTLSLHEEESAPGLVYFHIPLREVAQIPLTSIVGDWQEGVACAHVNSGFLQAMVDAGDVRAAFFGHDHVNDFCGRAMGLPLCYGGGTGYHAYGKPGWSRRARLVLLTLTRNGNHPVINIKTWKRLDDAALSTIDLQTLWPRPNNVSIF